MTVRTTVEIFVQILETVYYHNSNEADDDDDGITETGIMYDVYLSGVQLREYLISLTVHVLLIYDSTMRRYHITKRGIRFELYSKLDDMTMEEEEEKEIEI
jgi:predicted transcriptional regulator